MQPEPADEAGTSRRTPTKTDQDNRPPQVPDPEGHDDGSVPDKQIARWKGEGGSWQPAD